MTPSQQIESEVEQVFLHYPFFSPTRQRAQTQKSSQSLSDPSVAALWTDVTQLISDLESSNANPCVARYQINPESENVQ